MGAVHFLVALFRPLVWGLVALLIVSFGARFLKRLLSGISIFLLVLSIGGAWLMNNMLSEAMDKRYLSSDEISQLIVVEQFLKGREIKREKKKKSEELQSGDTYAEK